MEKSKANRIVVGDKVKITGLPVGSSLPRNLIGRTGRIRHVHNYGPGSPMFYTVDLDWRKRDRREWIINDLDVSKFEII